MESNHSLVLLYILVLISVNIVVLYFFLMLMKQEITGRIIGKSYSELGFKIIVRNVNRKRVLLFIDEEAWLKLDRGDVFPPNYSYRIFDRSGQFD